MRLAPSPCVLVTRATPFALVIVFAPLTTVRFAACVPMLIAGPFTAEKLLPLPVLTVEAWLPLKTCRADPEP